LSFPCKRGALAPRRLDADQMRAFAAASIRLPDEVAALENSAGGNLSTMLVIRAAIVVVRP